MGEKIGMKFLVLGCNGMAGHLISLYLHEKGYDVTGFAREKSKIVKSIVGDASDFELVKQLLIRNNFDAVINCIGVLNQFADREPDRAVLLNGYLPHFLAKVTEATGTQVIHMSTDCVFSGKTGGYTEHALRDGETFYDRTKAVGELDNKKDITLRNSIIGPDIKENGIGLLNWFMKQGSSVSGFRNAIWTGQTTLQLAKTMEEAAKRKAYGLVNTVPRGSVSKYELLMLFNKYIRKEPIEIIPQDTFIVDKSLTRTNYESFNYEIPDYETMILELGEWMRMHKEFYPHYNL